MAVRTSFTAGEVLAAADLTDTFGAKAPVLNLGRGISTNITLALSDAFKVLTITGSTGYDITVPPDSSVNFPVGSIVEIWQQSSAIATLVAGSGVTLFASTLVTPGTHLGLRLIKMNTNAWWVTPFSSGAGNADFSNAATGTYTDSGINYKYVVFTSTGTLTLTKTGFLDVLIVSGGGGGSTGLAGASNGGGGGGGVPIQIDGLYLSAATHTIVVGAGGATQAGGRTASPGTNSRISIISGAGGGGGGGGVKAQAQTQGGAGGNGGGGQGASQTSTGGASIYFGGFAGGNGVIATSAAGGGGGGGFLSTGGSSGSVGGNGTSGVGGAGGTGLTSTITGTSVVYGGGGGGSLSSGTGGAGGTGGGGAGGNSGAAGTAGTGNSGGGGGGGSETVNGAGGAGGSGVVIVRVRTN